MDWISLAPSLITMVNEFLKLYNRATEAEKTELRKAAGEARAEDLVWLLEFVDKRNAD